MIEKIKRAIDELTELKKAFEAKESERVRQFDDLGVIGLSNVRGYKVQVDSADALKKIADGKSIEVIDRKDSMYPVELSFTKEGVKFFVILDQGEYEEFMHGEEPEHIRPRGVTSNELAMKEAGHKLSDFM